MSKERVKFGEDNFSWIRYIRNRVLKKNKNFICSITGQTGSGKTYTALSIAEMIDPEFSSERVIFKAKDLMELINSGNLKSGSVLVWDEAGIELSNRNWQSQMNKVINYLLQTFRHRNFVVIFTMPYADFVDSASRKLFHSEMETVSINRNKKTCRIKPKCLQYNPGNKKWYRKYLKAMIPGVGIRKIKKWAVPIPTKKLIDEYELKKMDFTKGLNQEIENTLAKLNDDKNKNEKPIPTDKQQEVIDCWKEGIKNQSEIAKKLGVTHQAVSYRIFHLKKKGYFVEDY